MHVYVAGMDCAQEINLPMDSNHNIAVTPERDKHRKKCCRILTSPRQPDSPYAYLVCFCGVVCNLIMFGCSYSYGLLFPSLLDEFKEGKAKTGNSDVHTSCYPNFCEEKNNNPVSR